MGVSIDPRIAERRTALAAEFRAGVPFPHLVFDSFFSADLCARLAAEFPPFERGSSLNEAGKPADKAFVDDVRGLGGAFIELDDLLRSRELLELLGEITGIPDLLYDPDYVGGGTHENRTGQDLDPHVDFNLHPRWGWHRRLNLLVYLNPEWDEKRGGCLELHQDPRLPPAENRIKQVVPLMNRAVLFETSDRSWHGFQAVRPPRGAASPTRRSIAVYYYTKQRPAVHRAPSHATIYVNRPFPEAFRADGPVHGEDVVQVRRLIARRRQHLALIFHREEHLIELASERVDALLAKASKRYTSDAVDAAGWLAARLDEQLRYLYQREQLFGAAFARETGLVTGHPVIGLLRDVEGLFEDSWSGVRLGFRLTAPIPVESFEIRGRVPEALEAGQQLELTLNGQLHRSRVGPGPFSWKVPLRAPLDGEITGQLMASHSWCPRRGGGSADVRELAFWLEELLVE